MAIAEKWLADRYNQPGLRRLRLRHLRRLRRRLPDGGRRRRGRLARRPPAASTTSAGSTTTTTSRSKATPDLRSPRTSRRASWPTAGTCCASATPTTSIASSTRCGSSGRRKGRPTLIILDSHIGYGSPHQQDTAAAHGEPLGEDEIRLTKRAYGWPEDAKFLVPDGVREHFAAGVGARGAQARREWTELFARLPRQVSGRWRPRSSRCSGASCRRAGIATCPCSRPTRRASPAARLRARC